MAFALLAFHHFSRHASSHQFGINTVCGRFFSSTPFDLPPMLSLQIINLVGFRDA